MSPSSVLPIFPPFAERIVAVLPLAPLSFVAQKIVEGVSRRRPGLFDRLGEHADKRYLIDATDMPVVFRLEPRRGAPTIAVEPRQEDAAFDTRIAGPFAALLGMLHGTLDGDALFFSGDVIIEGDTAAALALRNALDDAQIDLIEEFAGSLGPLGGVVERPARQAAKLAEHLLGVAFVRGGAR